MDVFQKMLEMQQRITILETEVSTLKKHTKVGGEVSIKDIAALSGKTVQAIHYRLFNTPGVEPDKDFKKVGKGYMINTNCLGRLLNA